METKSTKPIQGAVATADLEQQKPHLEAGDSKLSAASSDEERLAAGISTIGLQTKRLSGAQQKKLVREKKMKEGTWTEKKPPRKIPSSQELGVLGRSGGVKRPHSDSSTPPLENSIPKNPGAPRCRLGHIRKLLPASSRWLFTDVILMPNWIRIRLT